MKPEPPSAETPSRDDVAEAAAGKPQAIDQLLMRHLSGLRAFVRLNAGATIRAREAQSDLVQSVCREVLEEVGHFEYRGEAAFKLWLFQTARRKIIDRARFWRRDKRAVGREVPLDPRRKDRGDSRPANLLAAYATFCTPSQDAILHEEQRRIEDAFSKLSLEHRRVVSLARVVGLSHREISEQLKKSEVAVRQLLHRALAALSRHLEAKSERPQPG